MPKITKATFKSFLKKNAGNLHVNCRSSFDGMTDCVQENPGAGFKPAVYEDRHNESTCGIRGVWLVGQGGDYFKAYEADGYKGIEVYNCCGSFIVAVAA